MSHATFTFALVIHDFWVRGRNELSHLGIDRLTENLKILIQSMASEVTLKKKAKVLKRQICRSSVDAYWGAGSWKAVVNVVLRRLDAEGPEELTYSQILNSAMAHGSKVTSTHYGKIQIFDCM